MIGNLLKKKLIVQIDMSRDENIINNHINSLSRQFAYNPDLIVENREDLLNRVKNDITNSTLSAGYITICDSMIHGYYGGRQHEGLEDGKFILDKNKLEGISQICSGTNRTVREINEKYNNDSSISKLKESFTALSKAYINLTELSPRYEFIAEACIGRIANDLHLNFSRDSLYEFDFLKAVEDSKISYDGAVKELADTMLHRHLLGGALDTNIDPDNIELYNDLYKNDPILGIRKVIEDKGIEFDDPEKAKELEEAIEKEPKRMEEAVENMERSINTPKPPGD